MSELEQEMKKRKEIREIMLEEQVSRKEARAIWLHRQMMANVEDFGDE